VLKQFRVKYVLIAGLFLCSCNDKKTDKTDVVTPAYPANYIQKRLSDILKTPKTWKRFKVKGSRQFSFYAPKQSFRQKISPPLDSSQVKWLEKENIIYTENIKLHSTGIFISLSIIKTSMANYLNYYNRVGFADNDFRAYSAIKVNNKHCHYFFMEEVAHDTKPSQYHVLLIPKGKEIYKFFIRGIGKYRNNEPLLFQRILLSFST